MSPYTQQRIDRVLNVLHNARLSEGERTMVRVVVEQGLREQDRDTRHACAEAVHANHPQYPSLEVCTAIMNAFAI